MRCSASMFNPHVAPAKSLQRGGPKYWPHYADHPFRRPCPNNLATPSLSYVAQSPAPSSRIFARTVAHARPPLAYRSTDLLHFEVRSSALSLSPPATTHPWYFFRPSACASRCPMISLLLPSRRQADAFFPSIARLPSRHPPPSPHRRTSL